MADEAIDEDLKEMDKIDQLSHPEVMALFSNKLAEIMRDPLLVGLPKEPTLDEVNSQIALEHGRAMIVNVRQQDELHTVLRKYTRFALFKERTEGKKSTVELSKGLQCNCLYMGHAFRALKICLTVVLVPSFRGFIFSCCCHSKRDCP